MANETVPMPEDTYTLTVQRTLTSEFLSDVMCAAFEGGYGWFRVLSAKRTVDLSWVEAEVEYDNPNDEGVLTSVLTLSGVAMAIQGIINDTDNKLHCGAMRDEIAQAVAERDAGMIDLNLADAIVQVAIMGDAPYG